MSSNIKEAIRLEEARDGEAPWKKWGTYLSERQWATVREDYREGGDAWDYFTHDQARSRSYRWGEDGIAGLFRRQAAALLRPGPVERQGPHSQGTHLWSALPTGCPWCFRCGCSY